MDDRNTTVATAAGPAIGGERADPRPRPPVEEVGDVALADLFAEPGCPLCRLRERSARRFVGSFLWESVTDVDFRERLARGRGFCPEHGGLVLAIDTAAEGTPVGSAILLESILRVRLADLEDRGRRAPRPRRGRRAGDPGAVDCPVCEQVDVAVAGASARILDLLRLPAWRATLAAAEPCIPDLESLDRLASARRTAAWAEVAAAQRARLVAVADRLAGLVAHSAHDRRHLRTRSEVAAVGEAAALLGFRASTDG